MALKIDIGTLKPIIQNYANMKQRELYTLGFNLAKNFQKSLLEKQKEKTKADIVKDEVLNLFEPVITPILNGMIDGIKDKLMLGIGAVSVAGLSLVFTGYLLGRKSKSK